MDPLEDVRAPQEKNARRPVATEARYRATLAQAAAVDPRGRFGTILVVARHTGHRINAICQLRAADVCLTRDAVVRALAAFGLPVAHADAWPHGALVWRSGSDKLGFEAVTPIGAEVRAALERYLRAAPRLGDAPLFPATGDDARAVHKVHAGYWLRRAGPWRSCRSSNAAGITCSGDVGPASGATCRRRTSRRPAAGARCR